MSARSLNTQPTGLRSNPRPRLPSLSLSPGNHSSTPPDQNSSFSPPPPPPSPSSPTSTASFGSGSGTGSVSTPDDSKRLSATYRTLRDNSPHRRHVPTNRCHGSRPLTVRLPTSTERGLDPDRLLPCLHTHVRFKNQGKLTKRGVRVKSKDFFHPVHRPRGGDTRLAPGSRGHGWYVCMLAELGACRLGPLAAQPTTLRQHRLRRLTAV